MGVYKSYKHGSGLEVLIQEYGVRKTYNALKRKLGKTEVRIKHNRLQMKNRSKNWQYT